MIEKVYLDYAATTPLDQRVLSAMLPYFSEKFGNPSSVHTFGQVAESALEDSRERIAAVLHSQADEVIFTSCGSESDNLALRGAALAAWQNRGAQHILTSPVEHHAVTHTVEQLAKLYQFELEYLPIDAHGIISAESVAEKLRADTAVVSVMYANNEIGSINPIADIGSVCRERGIPFHSDAVQAAAYLPLNIDDLNVDMLSLGAHKFYGPKGVGALYIRKGTALLPVQTGGGQEFGLRAGTSNIPYIVGMATALELAANNRSEHIDRLIPMRDLIINTVLATIPESRLTGHTTLRMPNHASFVFRGTDGNSLLMLLDEAGFACSSGSACKTGDPAPSSVLLQIGFPRDWAIGSLRVTLGIPTTERQVTHFLEALPALVEKARRLPVFAD